MKKLIALLTIMLMPTMAMANDPDLTIEVGSEKETTAIVIPASPLEKIVDKIPELNNAVIYNIKDKNIEYAAMFDAVQWNNFALALGYTPANTGVLSLSYNLGSLEKLGVTFPIIKDLKLEPMVTYSLSRINFQDTSTAAEGFGIGAKLLEIRFW